MTFTTKRFAISRFYVGANKHEQLVGFRMTRWGAERARRRLGPTKQGMIAGHRDSSHWYEVRRATEEDRDRDAERGRV